ncbi:MAG: sulfatase-like hydrolase/transferase [Proteobacteria bacterium]|nr:sulfatase-like hydrolase/transferase [Pseudomonadota bacterium]
MISNRKSNRGRKKTQIITTAMLLGLAACVSSCQHSNKKKEKESVKNQVKTPAYNVILVSIDTLRADRLNCYGYDKRKKVTPNIDAVARDGILFENSITASPWTTPAHLSMLTSLKPSSHGVTASFGQIWKDMKKGVKHFKMSESKTTLAEVLKENGLKTVAFTAGGTVDPKFGFNQGFDRYGTTMFKLDNRNMGDMFDWIAKNANRRFFVFWHSFETHAPYLHPDFIQEVLPEEEAVAVRKGIRKIRPLRHDKVWPGGASGLRKKEKKVLNSSEGFNSNVCEALYVGAVRSADRWFGKLVKTLQKHNLYENTLIVFTSDHGEEFSDHIKKFFYNNHGYSLFEEMVRVPLVIKLPGNKYAGIRVPQIARTVDIMPTILDILSIKLKESEMEGASLRALWENPDSSPSRTAFIESTTGPNEKKGIRTDRYKYIIAIDKKTVKDEGRAHVPKEPVKRSLYDLLEDPKERNDLLKSKPSATNLKLAEDFEQIIRKELANVKGSADLIEMGKTLFNQLKELGYIGD